MSHFVLAGNEYACKICRTEMSRAKIKIRNPPATIRAFMDDLTVTTESVPGARWILKGLEKLMGCARIFQTIEI